MDETIAEIRRLRQVVREHWDEIRILRQEVEIRAINGDSGSFAYALAVLKSGGRARRSMWRSQFSNGGIMYIELQRPDEHSKMQLPYIYIKTAGDDLVPWVASQPDLLADDWEVCT
jgi:hypothetical protein